MKRTIYIGIPRLSLYPYGVPKVLRASIPNPASDQGHPAYGGILDRRRDAGAVPQDRQNDH